MYGWAVDRAEAHVVRLSLLYALLDCSEQVELVHLQAALELWGYADRSAHHIFGDSLGNPRGRPNLKRHVRGGRPAQH